jgi:alpha-tubulin suppressor-like RCC1 family protein
MGYQLGVDLGTTFTAAAVARDGYPETVTLGTNSMVVPSVVYLGDGGLVVGHAAQRRATTDPSRVAREFKRRVGDPTPILIGGSPVAADLLLARLLAWVVGEVSGLEGGAPDALVVTHPANWGPYKLDLVAQAMRHVGLRVDRLVPEPVAAATFYASQRSPAPGSVIAVYDLGGGTFDATLVRSGADDLEIVGQPDGIERLGGIDFDHAVLRYACEAADVDLDALEPDDPGATAALVQLRAQCVLAKEALSAETAASLPVALPGVYREVRLTRGELEAMIRPALDETIVALRRTIASAHLTPADVSAVLLVGGSSRIPLVGQLVTAALERPIAVDARPKDAIALGAALVAAAHHAAAPPAARPAPPPAAAAALPAAALPAPARPAPPPARPPAPVAPPVPAGPEADSSPARPRPPASVGGPRPGRRGRLGAALLTVALGATGVLAWRTMADPASGTPPVTVAAGASHACALRRGTVECWGANTEGQASPPGEIELTAVSAGVGHTCGIRTDDGVTCWGADNERQASPPDDERFAAVAAGRDHTCGIRTDDTVDCWGDGSEGQRTPQGARRYTGISSGWDHTCGIRTDRTITCWGTDQGTITSPPDGEFVALDAGARHSCALDAGGAVACWGEGRDDESADPTRPPEGGRFTGVTAGDQHSCGLRADGTVECWGSGEYGQSTPLEGRFVSISAGAVHTCGVRADHSVECWGGLSGPPGEPG